MQVSFHIKSSIAPSEDRVAKEISKAILQEHPGLAISRAKIDGTVIGFFSTREREGPSASALSALAKRIAPEEVVVNWNFKDAPGEVLNHYLLLPAPESFEIKLKAFPHLTPSFMESLGQARPHLRKIDLRQTKGTAQLLHAYLSKQLERLSQANEGEQKELREKRAARNELIQELNDLNFQRTNLLSRINDLHREVAIQKNLTRKAHEAVKKFPILAEYRKWMDEKLRLVENELSASQKIVPQQIEPLTNLTEQIESLTEAIENLRNRFLDLDSAAVEILLDGSDLSLEERTALYRQFPHIVLIGQETTLDLSNSPLSLRQAWEKLKRLPQVKQVDLTGIQNLNLFDIIDLEKLLGVSILYTPPTLFAPVKRTGLDEEFKPLSTDLVCRTLRRFPQITTVDLTNWKEVTPFDILYLEITFPNVQFIAPLPETCEFLTFDAAILERVVTRFPKLTIQLKDLSVEQEKLVLPLAQRFHEANFQSDARVRGMLQDHSLLQEYLKRALDKNLKTNLSGEELRSLAIQRPPLATLTAQIMGEGQVDIEALQAAIEKIDVQLQPRSRWQPTSIPMIPSAFLLLIAKFSPEGAQKRQPLLSTATKSGFADAVEFLLENGADANHPDEDGQTPLFYAALPGFVDVARVLLERGAKVNHRDQQGKSPLQLAALYGHADLVKLLTEKGADVNNKDARDWTPLMGGVLVDHVDIAKILIAKGANVNDKNLEGNSLLIGALDAEHSAVAVVLIEKGANIHETDSLGNTPLIKAAFHGLVEVAKLLIEKGADVNHRNSEGRTALAQAERAKDATMIAFLKTQGAKK